MADNNSQAYYLDDEDSQAYQVRAFLRSIEPLAGNNLSAEQQVGRDLLQDYLLILATRGNNPEHHIEIADVALVLRYLAGIQVRPSCEHYAAGGKSNCGHLNVMWWLAESIEAAQEVPA